MLLSDEWLPGLALVAGVEELGGSLVTDGMEVLVAGPSPELLPFVCAKPRRDKPQTRIRMAR
jgi:hypothetical protein